MVLKEILFRSGYKSSIQFHEHKEETNYILKGKGITDVNGGSLGNIKVIIKLVVPTKLTSEQKTIIKNLADNTNVDKKTLDKRYWFGRIKDSMNS